MIIIVIEAAPIKQSSDLQLLGKYGIRIAKKVPRFSIAIL